MDHLPIPDQYKDRQMVVPHTNLVLYDKKGFSGFLERLHYTEAGILTMIHDKAQNPIVESILQEWLYFGALHLFSDVAEIPFKLDDFINTDDHGILTVTSRQWLNIFAALKAKSEPFSLDEHSRLQDALNQIARFLGCICREFTEWYSHLTPAVIFSIMILIESLYDTLRVLSGRETDINTAYMSPSPGLFFKKKMQANKWCLASIQGVLHGNASVAYFASLLPSFNSSPHSTCTDDKCNQVYQQAGDVVCRHVDEQCPLEVQCTEIFADTLALTEVLDGGSFPAIILQEIDGKAQIQVVDARDHPYIAISHVWAHGLGNPHANSMPLCQLRRLFGMIETVNATERPTALWIDTMCVPVHSKVYRKLSISRLHDTYKQASKVIVLDKMLSQVESANIPESICYLLCSDWMSRLWTLQEGLLPELDLIYIQFRDVAIPLKSLLYDDSAPPDSDIVETKLRSYLSARFLVRSQFQDVRYQDTRMLAIMQNLQRRRTTKPEDEPICIATLMNIDLKTFEGMPTMADIYRTLYRLPSTLIFAPGPRLTTPGYRWAPSTFLEQPITSMKKTASLASLGLATTEGFDFTALATELTANITIARNSAAYIIEWTTGGKSIFFLPNFTDYPDWTMQEVVSPAIIMDVQSSASSFSQPAVLVSIGRKGRITYGRYRLPGFVVHMNRTSPKAFPNARFEDVMGSPRYTTNWIID